MAPVVGEILCSEREIGNLHDPQAVAVKKNLKRLLYMYPEKFHAFVLAGGSIICIIITGHRYYAASLVQGGLQVPFTLKFVSPPDQTAF